MSNGNRPNKERDSGNKAQPSSEISKDIIQLRSRVDQLEKTQAEKNQWTGEIKGWVGKTINIAMVSGVNLIGKLCWIDRYTLCLLGTPPEEILVTTIIVHKGAIAFMYQQDEAA